MRQLNQTSEYAIRAMTYLAQQSGVDFAQSSSIAQELGLPHNYLVKLLKPMVERGLLASQRGRHGGFRLQRPPEAISLLDIVETLEPLGRSADCLFETHVHGEPCNCPLRTFEQGLKDALIDQLQHTTLADVLRFCREQPQSGYPTGARRALRRV